MKFGVMFEFHKIPEWYQWYFNYELMKNLIEDFKEERKAGHFIKLSGFYVFTKHHAVICLDIFDRDAQKKPEIGLNIETGEDAKFSKQKEGELKARSKTTRRKSVDIASMPLPDKIPNEVDDSSYMDKVFIND